ncbi:DUF359 domain-containing protein [Desulfurococcus amylolyticus]|uniref:Dephospho-coenzyme A kinase n=1 Tax=Desulfurococcus amylolyticus DSM 16532 TaxID=768672 RepID=I3XTN0_DESAM|nr:DUF359 domain-containing protein [Desulfurococcus amylolyticus]AFL67304.1 protein of unknown function DUF359 [Desulfurococcus amylolyticus DSM 16532]
MNKAIPVLKLPVDFRLSLSIPQGDLYVSPDRGLVYGLRAEAAVGDIVSRNHMVEMRITDAKTKRHTVDVGPRECDVLVVNPQGTISINSFTSSLMGGARSICVVGEEDLLVIPFTLVRGFKIIYGQPDVGVVISSPSRERVLKILKGLKPDIVIMNL